MEEENNCLAPMDVVRYVMEQGMSAEDEEEELGGLRRKRVRSLNYQFTQIGHEAHAREESSDVPDGGLSEETAISSFRRERDEEALEGLDVEERQAGRMRDFATLSAVNSGRYRKASSIVNNESQAEKQELLRYSTLKNSGLRAALQLWKKRNRACPKNRKESMWSKYLERKHVEVTSRIRRWKEHGSRVSEKLNNGSTPELLGSVQRSLRDSKEAENKATASVASYDRAVQSFADPMSDQAAADANLASDHAAYEAAVASYRRARAAYRATRDTRDSVIELVDEVEKENVLRDLRMCFYHAAHAGLDAQNARTNVVLTTAIAGGAAFSARRASDDVSTAFDALSDAIASAAAMDAAGKAAARDTTSAQALRVSQQALATLKLYEALVSRDEEELQILRSAMAAAAVGPDGGESALESGLKAISTHRRDNTWQSIAARVADLQGIRNFTTLVRWFDEYDTAGFFE